MRTHPTMAARFIMEFAEGYQKSWNIVSERSKADDREFIEQIVKKLATYENVQPNNFSIMGNSNGAAGRTSKPRATTTITRPWPTRQSASDS